MSQRGIVNFAAEASDIKSRHLDQLAGLNLVESPLADVPLPALSRATFDDMRAWTKANIGQIQTGVAQSTSTFTFHSFEQMFTWENNRSVWWLVWVSRLESQSSIYALFSTSHAGQTLTLITLS
jgi:hypothetical protein